MSRRWTAGLLVAWALSGCSLIIDSDQYIGTSTDAGGSDGGTGTDAEVDGGGGDDCADCLGLCLTFPGTGNVCCDRDGDSFPPAGAPTDCPSPLPESDCDDRNPDVYPTALPVCGDGFANDCLRPDPAQVPPIFNGIGVAEFGVLPPQNVGGSAGGVDLDRSIDIQILDPGPGAPGELRFVAAYLDGNALRVAAFDGDALIDLDTGRQAANPTLQTLEPGTFLAYRSPSQDSVTLELVNFQDVTLELAFDQTVGAGVGVGPVTFNDGVAVAWGTDFGPMGPEICRANGLGELGCPGQGSPTGFDTWLTSDFRSSRRFTFGESSRPGTYIVEDGNELFEGAFGAGTEFFGGRADVLNYGDGGSQILVAIPLGNRSIFLENLFCGLMGGASSCVPGRNASTIQPDVTAVALGEFASGILMAAVQNPAIRPPEIVARFIPEGELEPNLGVFPLLPMDLDGPIDIIGDPEMSGRSGPAATSLAYAYATLAGDGMATYWVGAIHACASL